MPEYLFVYGTLVPGQAPPAIAAAVARLSDAGPATIAGRLLDLLGVAVAGAREPATEILVGAVVRSERSSEAGLLGRAERATRLTAALVNGTAAHALDFDDTHTLMNGHPTAPVLPAALALAE